MSSIYDKYINVINNTYNVAQYDYFPQVEASELLYKRITLEDIYLPLSLDKIKENYPSYNEYSSLKDSFLDYEKFKFSESPLKLEDVIRKMDSFSDYYRMKQVDDTIISQNNDDNSIRIVIEGEPGCGKTTLCRRLTLALVKDDQDFLSKLERENNISFTAGSIPILLECKYIANLKNGIVNDEDFELIMYHLCKLAIGDLFNLSESQFKRLIAESDSITLILDGWDEAFDYNDNAEEDSNYSFFASRLDEYIEKRTSTNVLVTRRIEYDEPTLKKAYNGFYRIKSLDIDEIRRFCNKWVSEILSNDLRSRRDYWKVIDDIINSTDTQIKSMRSNPLELSLLLTISKNEGSLPENKSDLFKKLVDLYIYWSNYKNSNKLSDKSIKIFLSYIASRFTDRGIINCNKSDLKVFINDCRSELEGVFSQDISVLSEKRIINELVYTGLLSTKMEKSEGSKFTFSESSKGTHRLIQEYLTAYAIQAQYAYEKYNELSIIEIIEEKYSSLAWREVIVFLTLMEYGRLKQEIFSCLLSKVIDDPANSDYTKDLLFTLWTNGIGIHKKYTQKMLALLFSDSISERQILEIETLLKSKSVKTEKLISYIDEQFINSINEGGDDYSLIKAVLEALKALDENTSPFELAARMLKDIDNPASIVISCSIVNILCWCKYMRIKNSFSNSFSNADSINVLITTIRELIKTDLNDDIRTRIIGCIRELIIAGVSNFDYFFSDEDVKECIERIYSGTNLEYDEIVLSIAPVISNTYQIDHENNVSIKNNYKHRINNELIRLDLDKTILSLNICIGLKCWNKEEEKQIVEEIYKLYSHNNSICMGTARFKQIQQILYEYYRINDDEISDEMQNYWRLIDYKNNPDRIVFKQNNSNKQLIISFCMTDISDESLLFLVTNFFMGDRALYNNVAYLLRRGEIYETILKDKDNTFQLTQEDLLKKGTESLDSFYVINYALSMSKTSVNSIGDYLIGMEFLRGIKQKLYDYRFGMCWDDVIAWWTNKVLIHNEAEAAVVLSWLYELGIYVPDNARTDSLNMLLSIIDSILIDFNVAEYDKDSTIFEKLSNRIKTIIETRNHQKVIE